MVAHRFAVILQSAAELALERLFRHGGEEGVPFAEKGEN
jgi:hypothetical protein